MCSSWSSFQPASRHSSQALICCLAPSLPPRLRADLVRVYNGVLLTESFMEERISVISQSQLSCRSEQKKVERFEADLVTLTKYGKKLRDKNIIAQIAEVLPHLRAIKKTQDKCHQYKRKQAWPCDPE